MQGADVARRDPQPLRQPHPAAPAPARRHLTRSAGDEAAARCSSSSRSSSRLRSARRGRPLADVAAAARHRSSSAAPFLQPTGDLTDGAVGGSRRRRRASSTSTASCRNDDRALARHVRRPSSALTLVVGAIAYVDRAADRSRSPSSSLVLAALAAFLRPAIGVYLIVFLTLVGDYVDDGVVAVHQEHVEPRVDLLRQRLSSSSTRSSCCSASRPWSLAAAAARRPDVAVPPRVGCSGRVMVVHRRSSCFGIMRGKARRAATRGSPSSRSGRCSTSRACTSSSPTC